MEGIFNVPTIDDAKLLWDIESAFANVVYPGDDNLVYDNTDKYPDVARLKENFLGKHWKDLTIETITYHRDDLPFFTIEAFHFYLPALLIACISYPPPSELDTLPDNLISRLKPPQFSLLQDPYGHTWFNALVQILTDPQKRVVRDFLQWDLSKSDFELGPPSLQYLYDDQRKAIEFWTRII